MIESSSPPHQQKRRFPSDLLLHLHPRTVPLSTIRFTLTFGLGGMAATLLLVLFISGILLKLAYSPEVQNSYLSVRFMYTAGNFSGWLRNIHYWSGNLLVIVTFLHCCRVFLTGAIGGKRRLNWFVGLLLMGLVIFSAFSGYLLPWDQLAYWAATIFINMIGYIPIIGQGFGQLLRGGSEIGAATLANFYGLHTGLLPFVLFIATICHFWLIRKARGLVRQDAMGGPAVPVPVVPHLIVREVAVGLTLIGVVLLFSAMIDAPLSEPATPGVSPNPAKAAWFFLGLQELLMHLHPVFAICVFPGTVVAALLLLPYWRESALAEGVWFGGSRGRRLAAVVAVISAAFTAIAVMSDELAGNAVGGGATGIVSRGVLPFIVLAAWYGLGYALLTARFSYTRAEAVMAGFVFTVVALICLTITGIWFRGPGMQLVLPW